MKKILGTLAVSAMLVGSAQANPFTDVPRGHWAYNAINKVVQSGIMKGHRGGMFKGKDTVSRYEMAIIIDRLFKKLQGKQVGHDVRRTMDRLGEEFMDELDLIGARLTALENAFHEHVSEVNNMNLGGASRDGFTFDGDLRLTTMLRSADRPNGSILADSDDVTNYRARIGVSKKLDKADFYAQIQQSGMFGEDPALAGQNIVGMAGNAANDLELRRLHVTLELDEGEDYLRMGRMDVAFGDQAFIGTEDWDDFGRVYDGFLYTSKQSNHSNFSWNTFWYKVDDDNGASFGAIPGNETDVMGLNLDWTGIGHNDEGTASLFYYQANINIPGNPAVAAGAVLDNRRIDLTGINFDQKWDDWNFWFQYGQQDGVDHNQNGVAFNEMNLDGDMYDFRVDYDFENEWTAGIQWTKYSGDDNPTDQINQAFVPMFGSLHDHLGKADIFTQTNIEDIAIHVNYKNNEKSDWALSYHMFKMDEERGTIGYGWGMPGYGQLASLNRVGPLAAVPGNLSDDLGDEIDLTYKYKWSKNVDFEFTYANFSAGDFFSHVQNTVVAPAAGAVAHVPDVDYIEFTTSVKF